MKKLFYFGVLGFILFEAANVYFIMPMPGSQEMNSLDFAYFLHSWRWVFRLAFAAMILVGLKPESFRLVGMDHFNAMFEDKTTKSWWRQATGEAVAGKLKGHVLPELSTTQMTLSQWLAIYPNSLIMQADQNFQAAYDSLSNYEAGRRKGKLTRRDSSSWQDKSWVVGISIGKESKAYDWNALEKERIIHDVLDNRSLAIILAGDNKTFVALELPDSVQKVQLNQDTILLGQNRYNLLGVSLDPSIPNLRKINAYQEYWHSWRAFHPSTQK